MDKRGSEELLVKLRAWLEQGQGIVDRALKQSNPPRSDIGYWRKRVYRPTYTHRNGQKQKESALRGVYRFCG